MAKERVSGRRASRGDIGKGDRASATRRISRIDLMLVGLTVLAITFVLTWTSLHTWSQADAEGPPPILTNLQD